MSDRLSDAWAKLDWAKVHVDELREEQGRWKERQGDTPPFRVKPEFYLDHGYISLKVTEVDEIPMKWRLTIGDALGNFRSALEYLAWQLVQVGRTPHPPYPYLVGFPIHFTADKFRQAIPRRLPGIRGKHLKVIRKHQPYHWPKRGSLRPLGMLESLSNADKHRQIQLVYVRHLRYTITIVESFGVKIRGLTAMPRDPTGMAKPSAELVRILGRRIGQSKAKLKVNLKGSCSIAFENGLWVVKTLDDIGKQIGTILSEIEPLL